jgi:PAS domain S-box-containing protein
MSSSISNGNGKEQIITKKLESANEMSDIQFAKLNMIIKATNIGLWDMKVVADDPINPENAIVWSDEFRNFMGFKDENDFPNVIGSWSNNLHPDDAERTANAILAHLLDKTGKTPYDIEFRLKKKNGEYAYVRATSATVRDDEGNPIYAAGALVDMSEKKSLIDKAEEQKAEAENANRAKSEFLSHMSHELRTPMNAVIGAAGIQLQNKSIPSDVREAFSVIYNSGNLLLNIINDILDLSKIESGKFEIKPSYYEIPSLIHDTMQLNLLRYESKAINFNIKIDEATPLNLLGDELRIKQILNNILSNAFKYTDKGEVELSVSSRKENGVCILVLRVSDTGQGLTKEQIEKLYDAYERFNIDVNQTIVGVGLGLHITKNLVGLMNGEIHVESQPNKGTTFTIELPQKLVSDSVCGADMTDKLRNNRFQRGEKHGAQTSHRYMPYGRVLVVDDVESNLYVAKNMLLAYGIKVETVSSGFEAIEKIKNGNEYDVVFMDYMMPKMDGIQTAAIIRDTGYALPIIALTANAIVGTDKKLLTSGFDDYMTKPIDARELNTLLNRFIYDKQPPEVIEAAKREAKRRQEGGVLPKSIQSLLKRSGFAAAAVRDINNAIAVLKSTLDELESGSPQKDYDLTLFTTTVHGMKSALMNIEETELSSVAFELEQAGKNNDIKLIASKTPGFVNSLISLGERFKKAQTDSSDKKACAPSMALSCLCEKLDEILKACKTFNKRAAKSILDDLTQQPWSDEISKALEEISLCLIRGEFVKINPIVQALKKACS